jgi:chromosome segregation ATPase
MSRRILLRLAFPTLTIAGFLANTVIAQSSPSQDSQSVADAARRAREEKKKAAAKPGKVFTDDDVKPAAPAGSAAAAGPAASASDTARAQSSAGTSGAASPEDKKKSQEIAALKEQIKQAQNDLDLLKREQALQRDTYYSNPDFVHDTAGKAKLDDMKQQIADKQEALDRLKDHLAELGGTMNNPAATPENPPATPPQR